MSKESRRGFLGRLLGSSPGKDENSVEAGSDPQNESDAKQPDAEEPEVEGAGGIAENVIRKLEREGVQNKLPDETIRALTANQKRRKAGPAAEGKEAARASWRPTSVDPFQNGRPNVRAVELARELREKEAREERSGEERSGNENRENSGVAQPGEAHD